MKTLNNLNRYIDHTLLRANAIESDIIKLCEEAVQHSFVTVCVNPVWIKTCSEYLQGRSIKVCSVIGFPLGADLSEVKAIQAEKCIQMGAHELDMVMNVGFFKDKHYNYILDEIQSCKKRIGDKILKVIIETALLDNNEKRMAVDICCDAGADFVKTSTGFSTGGAAVEDIQLLRKEAPESLRIKASGGIRSLDLALSLIEAGADRIGTSSSVQLMKEWNNIS